MLSEVRVAPLFTETGRDIAGTALKYGGIAALGGLAWHAWQKHKAGQGAAAAPLPASDAAPPLPTAFLPQEPAAQDGLARLIVIAMVTAAKADGTVDSEEQGKILGHAEQLRLSDEEQGSLFAELGSPSTWNRWCRVRPAGRRGPRLPPAVIAVGPRKPR